ncbi:MAG: AAA family ATPase [Bryobacteraceae bacterium]|jgi:hypothetical protein
MAKARLGETADPVREGADRIADYLCRHAPGGIEEIYSEENSRGLFLGVKGDQEQRYLLTDLNGGGVPPDLTNDSLDDQRSYSVEELLDLNLPSPPPFIEELLHEGETIVIAGRQKVGKSRLTQQMALCLAAGQAFLGMRVPKPASVLMIDLENRPAPLAQRFRAMGGDPAGRTRLHVWCARSLDATLPDASPEGVVLLRKLVEQVRPDVLVIDTWRLWLGGDENDAREIVEGLKKLASVRVNLPHLAIVIVHHVRKERFEFPRRLLQDPSLWADAVSGHHALSSHVDACYGLERQMEDGEDPLIVFGGIARNTQPQTLILDEDDSLRFTVAANEDAALKVMTKAQQEIWKAIGQLPRFRFTQAVTAAKTTNKKAVSAALKIAESHGLLRREGEMYVRAGG